MWPELCVRETGGSGYRPIPASVHVTRAVIFPLISPAIMPAGLLIMCSESEGVWPVMVVYTNHNSVVMITIYDTI